MGKMKIKKEYPKPEEDNASAISMWQEKLKAAEAELAAAKAQLNEVRMRQEAERAQEAQYLKAQQIVSQNDINPHMGRKSYNNETPQQEGDRKRREYLIRSQQVNRLTPLEKPTLQ